MHGVTSQDKYERAVASGGHLRVVSPDWVVDSVRGKSPCDEELYHPRLLLVPKAPSPPAVAPQTTQPGGHEAPPTSTSAPSFVGLQDVQRAMAQQLPAPPQSQRDPQQLLQHVAQQRQQQQVPQQQALQQLSQQPLGQSIQQQALQAPQMSARMVSVSAAGDVKVSLAQGISIMTLSKQQVLLQGGAGQPEGSPMMQQLLQQQMRQQLPGLPIVTSQAGVAQRQVSNTATMNARVIGASIAFCMRFVDTWLAASRRSKRGSWGQCTSLPQAAHFLSSSFE